MQAQMNRLATPATRGASAGLAQQGLQLAAAALLGALIVYGVGFSPIAEVHNAAHDGRHSHTFPCH